MDGPSLRPTHWIGLVSMGKPPVTTQGPISIIRHSMLLVFLFISISNSLLLLLRYAIYQIAEEDKLEKVLENPQVIRTPVVRNGKQSTLGYQPDIWKAWK